MITPLLRNSCVNAVSRSRRVLRRLFVSCFNRFICCCNSVVATSIFDCATRSASVILARTWSRLLALIRASSLQDGRAPERALRPGLLRISPARPNASAQQPALSRQLREREASRGNARFSRHPRDVMLLPEAGRRRPFIFESANPGKEGQYLVRPRTGLYSAGHHLSS